ncbi:MAG: DegT/DnrJ/EryC1/StrS family aminotransferase [Thermofilaceae archaeon]
MVSLAIKGGEPVRKWKKWPDWPVYDERELRAIEEVLKSGYWGGGVGESGPWERKFEETFAIRHGCRYGICVFNGTAALLTAFLAAGIGPGDEVIVPALTFSATGSAALMVGATVVIVDVDPETYCMDVNDVERCLTEHTKAIVAVYNYGAAPDMDALSKLAYEYNLILIEDCARGHGFEWRGKPAGSIGDMGCFSFQQGKFMTAGEGGIIITNSKVYATRCHAIKDCGRVRGEIYDAGVFHWINWFNFRMTQFQAAILLAQLERFDEQLRKRQNNSEYLSKRLTEIDGVKPVKVDQRLTRHQPWPYCFKVNINCFGGATVERIAEALRAEGVPCSTIDHQPLNMTLTPGPLGRIIRKVRYPIAEKAIEEAITIPQWVFLASKEDMDDIAEAIEKVRRHANEL